MTLQDLLEEQREAVENIEKYVKNFKADPKARKAELPYYERKLKQLEEWWLAFDSNNTKLQELKDDNEPYFNQNTFEKVREVYITHRNSLQDAQEKLKKKIADQDERKRQKAIEKRAEASDATSAAVQSTSFAAVDLNALKELQLQIEENEESDDNDDFVFNDDAFNDAHSSTMSGNESSVIKVLKFQYNELKNALISAQRMDTNASSGLASMQLDNVKLLWSEFRASFREVSVGDDKQFCESINFSALQNKYLNVCGVLSDLANVKMRNKMIQLPPLKIPEFSGNVRDWRSFRDLYDKIVHNNKTIAKSIKIQYLKAYIKGNAAALVAHVSPNENNYDSCYKILCSRYENKRENLGTFIDEIMSLKKLSDSKSDGIKKIHDTVHECIMAINNIEVDTKNWDALLVHIVLKKLDSKTIIDYETQLKDVREPQKLSEFLRYLENRFLALASAESKNEVKIEYKNKAKESSMKCSFCNGAHSVYKCKEMKNLQPEKRFAIVKEKKLCFVCLFEHKVGECKSNFRCKICDGKHSSLLHLEKKSTPSENRNNSKNAMCTVTEKNDDDSSSSDDANSVNALVVAKSSDSVFTTAMVHVVSNSGEKILLRALIDNCAGGSFISEQAAQLLKLNKKNVSSSIIGIGECERSASKMVSLKIFSRFGDDFSLDTDAIVMRKLTKYRAIPDVIERYEYLKNLRLADPIQNCDEPIDIMLGTIEHGIIIKSGLIKGEPNQPIAQDSEFGWLISGGLSEKSNTKTIQVIAQVSNVEINKKLDFFFANDDKDDESDDDTNTEEEAYFDKFFKETTRRDEKGFTVRIPFKNGKEPKFGDSKKVAMATLFQLENRFKKNEKLKEQYTAAINDAIQQGHMKLISTEPSNSFFLPHHAVFKESTTTKLRTVFNASQKSSNGLSLNDTVAVGKIRQPKMLELLVGWRKYKIAVIGDIEKMYKQIRVADDQQKFLLVLWRNECSKKIEIYALTTVTFGVANAPCTAVSVLEALANEVKEKYPMASNAILHHFYMDDCLCGADTDTEAIQLYKQLKNAFLSAGFNIRKFVSNSERFLQCVPENDKEMQYNSFLKALGVLWCPLEDTFELKYTQNEKLVPTKRGVFSQIASLYDPLGIISPVTIKAKIIMQDIWQLSKQTKKFDWDDELPAEYVERWNSIKSELSILSNVIVPRWIGISNKSSIQLHGFCDASEKAYAAVVYVRYRNDNNEYKMSLIMSKSRVAPIKKLSIPKLELMGALLLAKLIKKSIGALNVEIEKIFLWTDSRIALAWIQGNPKRWKSFVASRVLKIEKKVKREDWFHISGQQNPADCSSRGILPSELKGHSLWWTGPSFLCNADFVAEKNIDFVTNEEIQLNAHVAAEKNNFLPECNSFFKLKRIFAYVLRFIAISKTGKKIADMIKLEELNKAEQKIIKCVQNEFFQEEIMLLKSGKQLKKSSKLIKLSVFLDEQQLLRVGGRLQNAINLSFDQKHQILIPHESMLSRMIIKEYHEKNMHAAPKLLECKIREMFWITNLKSEIKKVLNQCVECAIHKPRALNQLMGNLPHARVNEPKKVFENCAIDFAGPISIKASKLRNAAALKSYIAIFVCLATKALHIEAVSDLTAESFIAALRRFVARRSAVANIYSDNGTNFVKANRVLGELSEREEEQFTTKLHNESLKKKINWHFSPPASAHFNGLVEAAVKSTKFHLHRVFRGINLTFEELQTALCQIEAILNSRPICELSSDPNDVEALTPGHFLNVSPIEAIADEDVLESKANYLNRWQLVQKVTQDFWHRWREEYLHQLQVRNKWHTKNLNVKVGELVMLKDINLPSCKWPMGRIVELHPGRDGLTRVVTLKTANNTLKRGITEIAPLPVRI